MKISFFVYLQSSLGERPTGGVQGGQEGDET